MVYGLTCALFLDSITGSSSTSSSSTGSSTVVPVALVPVECWCTMLLRVGDADFDLTDAC